MFQNETVTLFRFDTAQGMLPDRNDPFALKINP
jgi:hypothetical protein